MKVNTHTCTHTIDKERLSPIPQENENEWRGYSDILLLYP